MNLSEWKEELIVKLGHTEESMKSIRKTLDKIDDVDEDFDQDEITAFTIIKFKNLEKKLEEIFT